MLVAVVTTVVIIGLAAIIIMKALLLALSSTHVMFIDMPDPDNYAAALLGADQTKPTKHWLAMAARWVLQRFGFPLCPLYIVCGGRRVDLGLAHKNTNGRFFDETTKSWLKWDFRGHIGPLPADKAVIGQPDTIDDSVLVLRKNMLDLEAILRSAGYSEFVLVTGHIAKQIPLSHSHHADEWRFYDNVRDCWVTTDEYDRLSNKRCDDSDESQTFDQRRELARQFINQLTGFSDFESSYAGSHWLTLDQLAVLCKYSAVHITMGGPATDMAYLVEESKAWTRNVKTINAMWAVCDLGQNTGKMNLCGMNFNEAADIHAAEYLSLKLFPNAMFSFLPSETCILTPEFKVTREMAESIDVLRFLAGKIALWTHVKSGRTEPLFDYFICESPDVAGALHQMGLVKVFVVPNVSARGYAILSPSKTETQFTAWVNPNVMFADFTWGPNNVSFNGIDWSSAKIVG